MREPTSEKLAAKDNSVNKEGPQSVNSHEVNSLVCAPRTEPASGNRWRECFQNFASRSKTSQLTKVCELASFWHRAEAGRSYKTTSDVDDVFGDFTPVCREFSDNIHFLWQTQDPERMQRFQEEQ